MVAHGTTARYPGEPSKSIKMKVGMDLWIARKEKRSAFLPYEEAKKVVNALGLKSLDDWYRWSRTERPPDIPSPCDYKNRGWNGLRIVRKKRQNFCLMKKKKQVYVLGLKSTMIGREVSNERPPEIPSNPQRSYKNAGWNGLADWLGKKNAQNFCPKRRSGKVVTR